MGSNFKLNGEKFDLELKEPFSIFAKMSDQPEWLHNMVPLRTFNWNRMKQDLALLPAANREDIRPHISA